MKPALKITAALLLTLAAYLTLWPVPVKPVAWQSPPQQPFTGDFAANTRLANLDIIPLGDFHDPEDIVITTQDVCPIPNDKACSYSRYMQLYA